MSDQEREQGLPAGEENEGKIPEQTESGEPGATPPPVDEAQPAEQASEAAEQTTPEVLAAEQTDEPAEQPASTPPENAPAGNSPPPQKSKTPIIIAAAAALIVVVVAVFMFSGDRTSPGEIGGVSRAGDPERYLALAMELSGLDAQGSYAQSMLEFSPFDLDRFGGGPVEHRFALRIDELYDAWGPSELMGAHGELRLGINEGMGSALLGLDVGMGGFAFNNNQIYLSSDLVALSVPDLYTRHEFVSFNPQTVLRDLAGSEIGEMLGITQADLAEVEAIMPIITSLGELFNLSAMESFMDEYYQMIFEMSDKLMTGDFLDEGDVEITVDGRTFTAAKLGYHIPEDVMAEFMSEFMEMYINLMRDYMGGFIELVAEMDPWLTADMIWDEMFGAMDAIRFPGGITHFAYVDLETNLVRRMDIPNMTIFVDDGWGGETVEMDMIIEMRGERRVYDEIHYLIVMSDGYDEFDFEILMQTPPGGPYLFTMEMDMGADGRGSFDMGFDPSAGEDNIWLNFTFADDWSDGEFGLVGTVVDESDSFTIENGRMTMSEGGNRVFAIGFEYGLRSVSAEDVQIDRDAAVSIFDLDLGQLQQDLMAAIMRMAMMM
ncbi:MAG: hypothetical protein FWE32_00855 [Oscillospiraceae bacterium]|nr:hypothetical protein [Oscillospiraceae bacterium]